MQTHPVPQNISSYEFRLVGDMTLKQFLFLAVGALLGLAAWKLPIPFSLIRGLIAIIPIGGGILAAFVPISGRPFTQWVSAFFKAIYAPTLFEWEAPVAPKTLPPPATPATTAKIPALTMAGVVTQVISPSKDTTTSTYQPPPPPVPTPKNEPLYISDEKPATPSVPVSTTPQNPSNGPAPSPLPPIFHSPSSPSPSASLTSSVATPANPNILTGLVVDQNQVSVAGATVEIIDSKTGIPTRALRTNRLGQFQIAIPLPVGAYTLQAEKEGYQFSPVSIAVNNTIIQPVLLSASVAAVSSTPETKPPVIVNDQLSKF